MSRVLSIVALIVLAVTSVGCCKKVKKQLAKCREDLSLCAPSQQPAFTLIMDDNGGTFAAFNNQLRDEHISTIYGSSPPPSLAYEDGLLLQVGTFDHTDGHAFSKIEMEDAGGNSVKQYVRSTLQPQWIDVVCGDTTRTPIAKAMATVLVPRQADTGTHGYVIHGDMMIDKGVTAITIWAPPEGLRVTTKRTFDGGNVEPEHGHVTYTVSSVAACEVRVYDDVTSASPADFTNGNVATLRVIVPNPPKHGGPHMPNWP